MLMVVRMRVVRKREALRDLRKEMLTKPCKKRKSEWPTQPTLYLPPHSYIPLRVIPWPNAEHHYAFPLNKSDIARGWSIETVQGLLFHLNGDATLIPSNHKLPDPMILFFPSHNGPQKGASLFAVCCVLPNYFFCFSSASFAVSCCSFSIVSCEASISPLSALT